MLLGASMLVNAGCSQKSDSSVSESAAEKDVMDNIVLTVETEVDLLKWAYSFEELCSDADFIAEVKITESVPKFSGVSGRVITEMTPEFVNIYKGEYNGEKLVTDGGIMPISEYNAGAEFPMGTYTDEELETGYVYYNWLNNRIPQCGDEIIFFGYLSEDDGNFHNLYSYQRVYFCDDENVTVYSLQYQTGDGWMEPLVHDFTDNYGAEIIYNDRTIDVVLDKEVFTSELL